MQHETAMSLNTVLDELRSAEHQFKYNMENQIMNGYPIRIMDECKEKLNNAVHLGLPDAKEFPELHAYLEEKYAKIQKDLERKRKIQEFNESTEGKRQKALQHIEDIQKTIKECTVAETVNEREIVQREKKREELKEKSRQLYQQLTQAQINFFMQFPSSS